MILYKLTFKSGKIYIGQTQRTMKLRMQQHSNNAKYGSPLAIHAAWRKYGEPQCEIIGEFKDADELHAAEIAAIKESNCLSPDGYNLGFGGETAPSKNPDVAAKIAAKATGRKAPVHVREAARQQMLKRQSDPIYMAKVREGQRAYWTPERRAQRAEESRARATGVKFTEERRAKIGAAIRNPSAETRAKMSASAKARGIYQRTPETCAKLSSAVAASWQDPEIRERRSRAIRDAKRKQSPQET